MLIFNCYTVDSDIEQGYYLITATLSTSHPLYSCCGNKKVPLLNENHEYLGTKNVFGILPESTYDNRFAGNLPSLIHYVTKIDENKFSIGWYVNKDKSVETSIKKMSVYLKQWELESYK